jgi:hypothetical protein
MIFLDNMGDSDEGEQSYGDELYDHYDDYKETTRDCIGWEEDMIKNGEPF